MTRRLLTVAVLAATLSTASAQTKFTLDKNKFTPQQDVQLGQEAAAEVRKEMPLLNDDRVEGYVERVGRRLVENIPPEYRQPAFRYSFDVVNMKEINAFALPGGPMFLNRGMIEAAKTEAEMAGVMAHEISHVVLRHGTAQATKAQKFQIGAVAGQILGAIVGGTAGSVIAQGSQFGLGAYFLKYGREYERQADLLGAQIMARAGYDPRHMANMFKTIQAEGRNRGPEWLSSHPDPGNRSQAITREAAAIRASGNAGNQAEFGAIKSRLTGMSPAPTAEQVARGQGRRDEPVGTSGRVERVSAPSGQYRAYDVGNFLRVAVPANWNQIEGQNDVTFAPDGGYYRGQNGGSAFTHGVQIGAVGAQTRNLKEATEALLQSFAQSNPNLRRASGYSRTNVGGREGLTTSLSNVSDVNGGREFVNVSTTFLRDGSMLYIIGVSPADEAQTYSSTFGRIRANLQIADR